jgi:hypothetical protein
MARWILRQIAEGWEDYVEIDQQDYATLLCIDSQLTHVLSVEDKYDVTMLNYLEFETSIAEEAIRKLVGYSRRREGYDELRRLLARRLSNVLSSAHLYLRTLNHHSKRILEEGSSGLAAIEAAPHHQYESSLDYRIAEALRNYAQHSALAVHGLISTKSEDDVSGLIDHVEPYLDSDDLKEDGQFKAKVLAELPKDGDLRRLKVSGALFTRSFDGCGRPFWHDVICED